MEENRLYEQPEHFSMCLWVRERLPDMQEGLLEAMAAEAVRAHLAVCWLCSKEYNEMERTVKLIETLPFVEPNRDFAPAVMSSLQRQSGLIFHRDLESHPLHPKNITVHIKRRLSTFDMGFWKGKRRDDSKDDSVGPGDGGILNSFLVFLFLLGAALAPVSRGFATTSGAGIRQSVSVSDSAPVVGVGV